MSDSATNPGLRFFVTEEEDSHGWVVYSIRDRETNNEVGASFHARILPSAKALASTLCENFNLHFGYDRL